MGVRVVSPPSRMPLLAPDVFTQLGLQAHHGEHVSALIAAATDRVESHLGRALITRTLAVTIDRFDCQKIELPYPPLVEVDAVRYLDDDGTQQTLDDSMYRVLTSNEPGSIELAYNESWPTSRPVSEAVEIEYKAGYGVDGANIPHAIRQAIVMMVGEWMEFREGLVVGERMTAIPDSVQFLLAGHRLGRLYAGAGM